LHDREDPNVGIPTGIDRIEGATIRCEDAEAPRRSEHDPTSDDW
jgi:hypothetical protein